jgi:hypothetical protein
MFVYNALTMPLVISFLSLALLWRNQRELAKEQQLTEAPFMAVPVRIRKGRP